MNLRKRIKKITAITLITILFSGTIVFAQDLNNNLVRRPRAVIAGTGSGGTTLYNKSNILFLSKYEIERYYGKTLSSGSSFIDWGLAGLISKKFPQIGVSLGFSTAVLSEAVERRASTLNKIKNNILFKGARGIKVTMKGKPYGYPIFSISFDTWW